MWEFQLLILKEIYNSLALELFVLLQLDGLPN